MVLKILLAILIISGIIAVVLWLYLLVVCLPKCIRRRKITKKLEETRRQIAKYYANKNLE